MWTPGWLKEHEISIGNNANITLMKEKNIFCKLVIYYIDKDFNSPRNHHDPIAFALLKLFQSNAEFMICVKHLSS